MTSVDDNAVLSRMPVLEGTERQVDWAVRIRETRIMAVLAQRYVYGTRSSGGGALTDGETGRWEFTPANIADLMGWLGAIRAASWWIETRFLGHTEFVLAAGRKGGLRHCMMPPKADAAAVSVLAEATLAPPKVRCTIAEVSVLGDAVQVALAGFDEEANHLLKRCAFRWGGTAWIREVCDNVAADRAIEVALRLLELGSPVRIIDAALRGRAEAQEYQPEPVRRVEVGRSEKYGRKFRLIWTFDLHPQRCRAAARMLRGVKVFEDAAYVGAGHYEDIVDFAAQHGFTIASDAQALIEAERAKILDAPRMTAKPKRAQVQETSAPRPEATGEIDAELHDE